MALKSLKSKLPADSTSGDIAHSQVLQCIQDEQRASEEQRRAESAAAKVPLVMAKKTTTRQQSAVARGRAQRDLLNIKDGGRTVNADLSHCR